MFDCLYYFSYCRKQAVNQNLSFVWMPPEERVEAEGHLLLIMKGFELVMGEVVCQIGGTT